MISIRQFLTPRQQPIDVPDASQVPRRDTILVTGLPGSGKTSLVESPHFPKSAVAVTFSEVMEELLAERHNGKSLRELWPQDRSSIQVAAAQRIAQQDPGKKLVVDGHLVVPTPRGWESGVPHQVWRLLRLTAIVVIFVPIQELVQRADGTLTSNATYATEEVQVAQSFVHTTAAHYSSGLGLTDVGRAVGLSDGCAFKCITNARDRWEDAQRELAEYVRLFL